MLDLFFIRFYLKIIVLVLDSEPFKFYVKLNLFLRKIADQGLQESLRFLDILRSHLEAGLHFLIQSFDLFGVLVLNLIQIFYLLGIPVH